MGIQCQVEGNELVVRVPLAATRDPSASGKTVIVASTRGAIRSTVELDGKPVFWNLSAWIKRD